MAPNNTSILLPAAAVNTPQYTDDETYNAYEVDDDHMEPLVASAPAPYHGNKQEHQRQLEMFFKSISLSNGSNSSSTTTNSSDWMDDEDDDDECMTPVDKQDVCTGCRGIVGRDHLTVLAGCGHRYCSHDFKNFMGEGQSCPECRLVNKFHSLQSSA